VRSPAELTASFRARGLKITPQRQLIFRILDGNDSHPTAESVYTTAAAEMPTISLRTVYQTLNDLSAMGEIQTLELGTGSARFDPLVARHHHMVCDRCQTVQDVFVEGADELWPSGDLEGFAISGTAVLFRGLCADCQITSPNKGADRNG
jgi:Fe2+ or Zn2+ uptake regulation protein